MNQSDDAPMRVDAYRELREAFMDQDRDGHWSEKADDKVPKAAKLNKVSEALSRVSQGVYKDYIDNPLCPFDKLQARRFYKLLTEIISQVNGSIGVNLLPSCLESEIPVDLVDRLQDAIGRHAQSFRQISHTAISYIKMVFKVTIHPKYRENILNHLDDDDDDIATAWKSIYTSAWAGVPLTTSLGWSLHGAHDADYQSNHESPRNIMGNRRALLFRHVAITNQVTRVDEHEGIHAFLTIAGIASQNPRLASGNTKLKEKAERVLSLGNNPHTDASPETWKYYVSKLPELNATWSESSRSQQRSYRTEGRISNDSGKGRARNNRRDRSDNRTRSGKGNEKDRTGRQRRRNEDEAIDERADGHRQDRAHHQRRRVRNRNDNDSETDSDSDGDVDFTTGSDNEGHKRGRNHTTRARTSIFERLGPRGTSRTGHGPIVGCKPDTPAITYPGCKPVDEHANKSEDIEMYNSLAKKEHNYTATTCSHTQSQQPLMTAECPHTQSHKPLRDHTHTPIDICESEDIPQGPALSLSTRPHDRTHVDRATIIFDSGSSVNVHPDTARDTEEELPPSADTIITGGGIVNPTHAIRRTISVANTRGKSANWTVKWDACNGFDTPVLSVHKILSNGKDNAYAKLTREGGYVRMGKDTIPLYVVDGIYTMRYADVNACTYTAQRGGDKGRITLDDAHILFGHTKNIKSLIAFAQRAGYKVTNPDDRLSQCVDCDLCGMKAHPHTGRTSRAESGRWSVDLKVAITDLSAHTDAFLCVEYNSLYAFARPIKNMEISTLGPHWMELNKEFTVTHARMDKGRNMTGLQKLTPDVTFETTQGYDAPQNGLVEVYNGVFNVKMNTLLSAQHLNKRLWHYAYSHAVDMHNSTPHTRHDFKKSPADVLGKDNIHTPFLLPFGVPVMLLLPKVKRNKNDTYRSVIGIYIGARRNGYAVWTADGITISRDVKRIHDTWMHVCEQYPEQTSPLHKYLSFDVRTGESRETLDAGELSGDDEDEYTPRDGADVSPPLIDSSSDEDDDPIARSPVPGDAIGGTGYRYVPIPHSAGSDDDESTAGAGGLNTEPSDEKSARATDKGFDIQEYLLTARKTNCAQASPSKTLVAGGPTLSFKASQRLDDAEEARTACVTELKALFDLDAFAEVPIAQRGKHKPVIARMKIRRKQDGRVKGRLCGDGRPQMISETIKAMDTYAPTASPIALMTLVSVAATRNMHLYSCDVSNAYIQSDLSAEVYINFEPGLPGQFYPRPGHCYQLRKALYGLPPSGRIWFETLKDVLKSIGYSPNAHDGSLFTKRHTDGKCTYVLAYVDDLLCCARSRADYDEVANAIKGRGFPLKEFTGSHITYLSHDIRRSAAGISVSQSGLAQDVVDTMGMTKAHAKGNPIPVTCRNQTSDDGDPLDKDDHALYMRVVGKIGYLCNTRPDLLYARQHLSRFLSKPTTSHLATLKHTVRYINGTIHHGLTFKDNGHTELLCYSDSDFATDLNDRRSITGGVTYLGGNYVAGYCGKQKTMGHCSTVAEIRAAASNARRTVYHRHLVGSLDINCSKPTTMLVDNQSAIHVADADKIRPALKHEHIDIIEIRERRDHGDITYSYVPSADNHSDICTKPLPAPRHKELADHLIQDIRTFHQ